jgi:hypothetical protein
MPRPLDSREKVSNHLDSSGLINDEINGNATKPSVCKKSIIHIPPKRAATYNLPLDNLLEKNNQPCANIANPKATVQQPTMR